jgi:hypothetical protein
MMTKGEKSKLALLAVLLALAAAGFAVSAYARFESKYRARIGALEKAIAKLEVGDSAAMPEKRGEKDAQSADGLNDVFDVSMSVRKSLVSNGFTVIMEKTEANSVDMQARSENVRAVAGYIKDLFSGKVEYKITSLNISTGEKGSAMMEIRADGKK